MIWDPEDHFYARTNNRVRNPDLEFEKALNLPDDFVPLLGVTVGVPQEALSARRINMDKIKTDFV